VEQVFAPHTIYDPFNELRSKPSPKLAREAVAAFLRKADARNSQEWARWCAAINPSNYPGLADARIVERVESTFLDLETDQRAGLELLRESKSTKLPELAFARAKLLLDPARGDAATQNLWCVPDLLAIVKDSPEARDVARAVTKDARPLVRSIGVRAAEILPAAEYKAVLLAALEDPDLSVRQQCAYDLAVTFEPRLAPDELARSLEKQTDQTVRRHLSTALKNAEEAAARSAK
jgi:hypothetical protein